jgi:hypothetical protein
MGQAEPTTWMPAYGVATERIDRDELAGVVAAAVRQYGKRRGKRCG